MDSNIVALINRRERQMLIHSHLYYELNNNIWDDKQFDHYAYDLARLLKEYPEEAKLCEWERYFRDWDGTTGFHLPLTHPWVIRRAWHIWEYHKQKHKVT